LPHASKTFLSAKHLLPGFHLYQRGEDNLQRHLLRSMRRVGVLIAVDLVVVLLSEWISVWAFTPMGVFDLLMPWSPKDPGLASMSFGAAAVLGLVFSGAYHPGDGRRSPSRIASGAAIATAIAFWQPLWTTGPAETLPAFAAVFVPFAGLLFSARRLVDAAVRRYRGDEDDTPRLLFVGPADACQRVREAPAFADLGEGRNLGFVDTAPEPSAEAVGQLGNLAAVLQETRAEAIVLCGRLGSEEFHAIVDTAQVAGCQVFGQLHTRTIATPRLVRRNGESLVELVRPELKASQLVLKRLLDLTGAIMGLVLFAPVFALVWLAIKLDSPGPGWFVQLRIGRNGRVFRCFKFRTMYPDAEVRLRENPSLYAEYVRNNYKLPEGQDPRITRVGRIVRRWSLDELPQLVNVVMGQMSLVGPRPLVIDELGEYGHRAPALLSLHPGMTGAWAIAGRSTVGYPERCLLELSYVRHWSIWADLRILCLTVPLVLRARGAH
jgi:lipopolysaccharide/colanic/teichoic acid biosynthesis glycosyltransferase